MMQYFTFMQNNSGGHFSGPAYIVIVEAPNALTANALAEYNGLYFEGCRTGRDCSCCGDRWDAADESDGKDAPEVFGKGVPEYIANEVKADRGLVAGYGEECGAFVATVKPDGTMWKYSPHDGWVS